MNGPRRDELLRSGLWLSALSVAWGAVSGGVAVIVGLLENSLGVLGLGLNVLADLAGSVVLIWRFRAELHHERTDHAIERRAAMVVAVALATVSVVLAAGAIYALAEGSHPGSSAVAMVSAGVAFVVLAPLSRAKRRVGKALPSRALEGDGTLSGIGAAIGLLALAGLALDSWLDWWWADRVVALGIAAVAAVEASRVIRDGE
jgi:divalent metal cation (Fe/Co/Zn/Cd) transporter